MRAEELSEIIKLCKQNNRLAQEKLYREYSPVMFAICKRYSSYSDAEDILQEGFLRIFDKIGTFKNQGSFEGWMKRIFINLALEKYKRNKRLTLVEDNYVFDKVENTDIFSQLSCKELMSCIEELSPQYKIVFSMYAIDGFSHKEIGKQLNISEGTSKSNLSRARRILSDKVKTLYNQNKKVLRYE
jgi:RNA polymerase sigma-70 factor (ECF subfamily)